MVSGRQFEHALGPQENRRYCAAGGLFGRSSFHPKSEMIECRILFFRSRSILSPSGTTCEFGKKQGTYQGSASVHQGWSPSENVLALSMSALLKPKNKLWRRRQNGHQRCPSEPAPFRTADPN